LPEDVDACGDEDVDVPFFEDLDDAACAMAAVPPIRAPEMTRAVNTLVTRCRMFAHLLPGRRQLIERGSESAGRKLGVG
jgi:hypothetical protein